MIVSLHIFKSQEKHMVWSPLQVLALLWLEFIFPRLEGTWVVGVSICVEFVLTAASLVNLMGFFDLEKNCS